MSITSGYQSLLIPVFTVSWKKIRNFRKNRKIAIRNYHKFRNLSFSKIAKVAKIAIFAISQITQFGFRKGIAISQTKQFAFRRRFAISQTTQSIFETILQLWTWVKFCHDFVTEIMTTQVYLRWYVPEKLRSLIRKVTFQNMHFRKVNLQNTRSQKQCPRPKMLTQILRIPLNLTQKLKNQILLLTILGLAADKLENFRNFHFSLTSQVFSSEFFLLHFLISLDYF